MRIFRRYRVNLADSFEAVSESLYLEFNITDMGRDGAYRAQGIEVRSGKDLLNLFEGKDLEATPQNVAHHYGMPLFYRTVLLKQGRFICATPSDDDHAARLVGRRLAKQQDKGECISVLNRQAWSGYQILLPLTLYAQDDPSDVRCGKELLDSSYLKQEQKHMPSKYNCRIIAKNEVISESMHTSSAQEKIGYAQKICDALSSLISDEESLHTVYALEMMKMGSLDLELYLKGLFLFIAKKQKYRLLFRLLFSDEYALGEAVRRFSIFYGRNGKNPWMGKTQVAFCSAKKEYFPVRLVLAGEEITTARVTAKQYMQYNIDIESGFLLSQIKYLTPSYPRKEKNVPETCPLFPFDLVPFPALKINGAEGDSKKSDFERKISGALKAELQESGCGCKICNAHIRLGSKIHIQDFYDAELLFQSVGNIYRFAYLIAEEILQCIEDSWGESHPLYLIGYENYSSVLVEEIIRLLGKAWPGREKNIWHFQYIKTDDSEEKIIDLSCHSEALAPDTIEVLSPDAIMVTILPIGTTLSTIYKIRNTFFRKYEITLPLERQYNFSLILVRPLQELDALGGASEDNTGLGSGRFWKPGEGQTVVLMPENIPENDSLGKITVRWFFAVETRWMAPDDCDLCNNDMHTQEALDTLQMLPLSQVDKTSTLPTLIFPARRAGIDHGISFSICGEAGENVNRLDEMKGCVEYGHILRDANHYQFYIDYQKYYQNVREGCTEWFADIQQKIDHDAFNIIISPLQPDNCRFIKDAIDHLFLHSLRFIYIPLHQVYREEIRSRFSYIAKEYQDACVGSILPKYHVYYIDYTIVSGESLHRSRTLIQMLLNDVIPRIQVGFFEKIILLTNRSSFDTAATFVRDPKTDFLAYSTLCIPSYNTLRNRCPACEMVETYQTIAKCSATNELFWHYFDLAQKHKLLSLDDHRRSLERIHFSKSNYLSYFYQSLVLDLDREFTREKEIDFIEFKRDFKEDIDTVSSKCPKRLTLGEVLATVSEKNKAAIYSYYKALIAGRNWRRLICTHEAVSMADRLLNNGAEAKTAVEIGVEMLDTISARLLSCQDASPFEKREWLISYIKTFSREYPSKIAPIRAAAYILLELFFLELISKPSQPDDSQEQLIKNMPDLQQYPTVTALLHITEGVSSDADIAAADRLQIYQLYLVLGKRLCDLQSNLLLRYTTLMQVDAFLVDLRYGQQESLISSHSYSKLLELPKSDRLQSDYLYMIKWAAMSSSEEAKAFLLQELVKRVSKAANSTESSNQMGLEDQHDSHPLINANFAEVIRQENTRVLYTGIKRLHEVVKYEVFNWGDLVAKVEGVMHCSGWSEEHNYQPMYQNPLCDLFKYLEEDLNLYHGGDTSLSSASQILAALLTFYRLMEKLENKSERETAKDYIDVYNQACFILSKLGNYRNCCLIHKTNGENVVIAQYLTDCVENLSEELQRILNDSTTIKQLEEGTLYNTVARYKSENGCVSAMVLAFRIKQGSDITYQQKVYAVLFSMETKNCEGDVLRDAQADRSHYLLFMRQQFQASLERDLYALHHFMLSRDDVGIIWPDEKDNSSKSVTTPEDAANPEGSVASEEAVASKESTDSKGAETPLCVLHLSDLHVSKENKDAILDLITSNVAELKKLNPQLLLITGDIVQGTGSAVDLEENYKCAGHVIRRIAEVLWTTTGLTGDQKTLHGDWKKRIIIIPGNHDYSSMNELVASSTLRVTKLGIPTQRPGSPMSRYAYYIQFLQNFLDIDSRQTIQNNLNAVVEYPAKDFMLRFIALNSVAEVGPLRNNKVQLDGAYIKSLPKLAEGDNFLNICLSHHTWCYIPDYFMDRYGAGTPNLTESATKLAKEIIKECAAGRKRLVGMESEEVVKKDVKNNLEKLIREEQTGYKCLSKDTAGSEISQDILYLQEHWAEVTDERCQHIILDYEINEDMAKIDLEEYKKRIKDLTNIYPISIMLGGHTHQAGWTVSINHGWVSVKDDEICKGYACAEAPKFYCPQEGALRFGRLLIRGDGDNRELEYQFVPQTPIRQLKDVFS